jgi:hypothetical protein
MWDSCRLNPIGLHGLLTGITLLYQWWILFWRFNDMIDLVSDLLLLSWGRNVRECEDQSWFKFQAVLWDLLSCLRVPQAGVIAVTPRHWAGNEGNWLSVMNGLFSLPQWRSVHNVRDPCLLLPVPWKAGNALSMIMLLLRALASQCVCVWSSNFVHAIFVAQAFPFDCHFVCTTSLGMT